MNIANLIPNFNGPIKVSAITGDKRIISAVEANELIKQLLWLKLVEDHDSDNETNLKERFEIDRRYWLDGNTGEIKAQFEHQDERFDPTVIEVTNPEQVKVFVNVHLYDRAYGGPEEGGWWYDLYTPVESEECTLDKVAEVIARLNVDYNNNGRRSVSSVLSEGQYTIKVEVHPGEVHPRHKPHYE